MEQVAFLSSLLFEGLQEAHGLSSYDEELLLCAALLHDIGISVDYRKHHKHSRDLILKGSLPALTASEKDRVALLARYHRKAQPKTKHKVFGNLSWEEQGRVKKMAGLLRVADGLDRAHTSSVQHLDIQKERDGFWRVRLQGSGDLAYAAWGGQRKASLLEETLDIALKIQPF